MKTKVILNPKAGNGRALKLWPDLSRQCDFLKPFEKEVTQKPGHMTELTRNALKAGFERILVVGGDGSFTEALNGFFDEDKPINPNARLGTLPLGSGSDFLKTFGIFSVQDALESLKKNKLISCDVGQVTYVDKQHKAKTQLFFNISSFGCAGEIVDRVNRSEKWLGPTLTYFGIMAHTFLTYKNPKVELELNGYEKKEAVINNLFVCNGKYSGSGMMWGPRAKVTDQKLDLTIVTDIPKLQGILNMQKIYQGKVLEMPGVEYAQCESLKASSKEKVYLEVDGDTVGTLPATFRIFPHKISLWY